MLDTTPRRLLAVLAHPDDETFGCGGVLAKYAAEGAQVSLICATRGEVGEISDISLATPENLPQVREQELREACRVLGIHELFILGYRDSGMSGTADNQNPQALCRADLNEVVGKVVEVIRNLRPQVMLTFDPGGGYGHPDHITMHHAAREAFKSAADLGKFTGQGASVKQPNKLYYIAFPRSTARALQEAMKSAGVQSGITEMDVEAMGVPDKEITTIVDVSPYSKQKDLAIQAHRTQTQGDRVFASIPEDMRLRFLSTEYLIRAEPPFNLHDDKKESDLFWDIAV